MFIPKAVVENDKTMSAEMLAEQAKVQKVLFDRSISNDEANAVIDDFNARWIAAGGISASTIIRRK